MADGQGCHYPFILFANMRIDSKDVVALSPALLASCDARKVG